MVVWPSVPGIAVPMSLSGNVKAKPFTSEKILRYQKQSFCHSKMLHWGFIIKVMKDQVYTLQTNIEVCSGEVYRRPLEGKGNDLRIRKVHFARGGCSEDGGWL